MSEHQRQRQFETLLQEYRGIVFKVASVYARGHDDRSDLALEIAALAAWLLRRAGAGRLAGRPFRRQRDSQRPGGIGRGRALRARVTS